MSKLGEANAVTVVLENNGLVVDCVKPNIRALPTALILIEKLAVMVEVLGLFAPLVCGTPLVVMLSETRVISGPLLRIPIW